MRPLLVAINAKYIHTNNAIRLLKANSSFAVDLLEFTIKDKVDDILNAIRAYNPLFVGFSTYLWNVEMVKILAQRLFPTPIVLGGPEVSYDAKYFLDYATVIVKGEGEHVFDDVVRYFKYQTPLDNTPNITTHTTNNTIQEIPDLSVIKSPYLFLEDQHTFKQKIAYIESSRGCPYKCTYCLSSLEKKVRFFPFVHVIEHIEHLQNLGVKTFKFLDRTFNANPRMLDLILWIIKHHQPDTVFQFEITGDTFKPQWIKTIHQHAPKGLFRFEIGIQSLHEETNILVERSQNQSRLLAMIEMIQKANVIELHLDLIAGLPNETLAMFKDSFNQVYHLGAKELQLGFLKMLRGTKIRNNAQQYEYQYNALPPYEILRNDMLSEADLNSIKQVEHMLNIFHNKGFFNDYTHHIITHYFDSSFDAFIALYTVFKQTIDSNQYQIDQLYACFSTFLKAENIPHHEIETLKQRYLIRAKVKPKCYFPIIQDKSLKNAIFKVINKDYPLSINQLFKHSILTDYHDGYLLVYYESHQATAFIVHKKASSYTVVKQIR